MSHDHTRPPKNPRGRMNEPEVEEAATESGFTVEQDEEDGDHQLTEMPQGFLARRRVRKQAAASRRQRMLSDLIESGMPIDSEHGFDPSTYTGRAGLRIATSAWWKAALIAAIPLIVCGWFILLYTRPDGFFSLALRGALVAVPAALFYLLGRVPRL